MQKASYSLSAIRHCKQLVQNTSWSTRLKSEHYSRSAEINSLFVSCQELLNSILFCPDFSPAYDYQQMVISKKYTKAQLDNQLRVCRSFANAQISLIEDAIKDGSVDCVP